MPENVQRARPLAFRSSGMLDHDGVRYDIPSGGDNDHDGPVVKTELAEYTEFARHNPKTAQRAGTQRLIDEVKRCWHMLGGPTA